MVRDTRQEIDRRMPQETILVIDDNKLLVDALTDAILLPLGYRVVYADNGQSGLEMILIHQPDVIMLDMNLPDLTGLDMLAALRQRNCQTPVIFMTMFGSESLAVEAVRLGAVDYLAKPFSDEDVEQAILRALNTTRLPHAEDDADNNLIAAKTVRQTAVTLSHYINNHLMALTGGLSLLQENLQHEFPNHPLASKVLTDGQTSVGRIEQVMRALQQITEVRHVPYYDDVHMIDVEAALRDELNR